MEVKINIANALKRMQKEVFLKILLFINCSLVYVLINFIELEVNLFYLIKSTWLFTGIGNKCFVYDVVVRKGASKIVSEIALDLWIIGAIKNLSLFRLLFYCGHIPWIKKHLLIEFDICVSLLYLYSDTLLEQIFVLYLSEPQDEFS